MTENHLHSLLDAIFVNVSRTHLLNYTIDASLAAFSPGSAPYTVLFSAGSGYVEEPVVFAVTFVIY